MNSQKYRWNNWDDIDWFTVDIAQCFDKIDHQKLLNKLTTYPSLRKQIKAWLKCGVIDKNWNPTEEGTPQGGVISPLLANIALHGMELEIKKFARTLKGKKANNERALSLIRYADDFVILHKDLEVVIKAKEIIENWLADIGLELKPSKTRISHTLHEHEGNVGFDLLGFNVRQYPVSNNQSGTNTFGRKLGFKTIIKPSKAKVQKHIEKLSAIVKKHRSNTQTALINELNPVIRGWSNYYRAVCSKEVFSTCDHILDQQLKRWGQRRHPRKKVGWCKRKYWHSYKGNNWTFATKKEGELVMILYRHNATTITRHTNSYYSLTTSIV